MTQFCSYSDSQGGLVRVLGLILGSEFVLLRGVPVHAIQLQQPDENVLEVRADHETVGQQQYNSEPAGRAG